MSAYLPLFPSFPYTPAHAALLASTRARHPNKELVIDKLLQLAQITVAYPPVDEDGLHTLLEAVDGCAFDTLKRDCLVFYLLRDLDFDTPPPTSAKAGAQEDDMEEDEDEVEDLVVETVAEEFAGKRRIPVQYRVGMSAFWCLDHGLPSRAIAYTTDARFQLDPTLLPHILLSLLPSSLPPPSPTSPPATPTSSGISPSEALSSRLTLQFLRATHPTLTEWEEKECNLLALATRDMGEAWAYVRELAQEEGVGEGELGVLDGQVDWAKATLKEDQLTGAEKAAKRLIEWCFIPKPRPTPIRSLLSLPIPPLALPLLTSLSLHPPPSFPPTSLPILHTLLHTRLIQAGLYAEAAALDAKFSTVLSSRGVADRLGAEGGRLAGEAARGRKQAVARVAKALPKMEREMIELANAKVVIDLPPARSGEGMDLDATTAAAGGANGAVSPEQARPEPLSSSLSSKTGTTFALYPPARLATPPRPSPATNQRAFTTHPAGGNKPPSSSRPPTSTNRPPAGGRTQLFGAAPTPSRPKLPSIVPFAPAGVAGVAGAGPTAGTGAAAGNAKSPPKAAGQPLMGNMFGLAPNQAQQPPPLAGSGVFARQVVGAAQVASLGRGAQLPGTFAFSPTASTAGADLASTTASGYPQPSLYLQNPALATAHLSSSALQGSQMLSARELQKRKREMDLKERERAVREREWEGVFGSALAGQGIEGGLGEGERERERRERHMREIREGRGGAEEEMEEGVRKKSKRSKTAQAEAAAAAAKEQDSARAKEVMRAMEEDRLTSVEPSGDEEAHGGEQLSKSGRKSAGGRKSRTPTATPRRRTRARASGAEEGEVPPVPPVPQEHEQEDKHPQLPGAFDLTPDSPTPALTRGRKRAAPTSPDISQPMQEVETPRATRRKTRAAASEEPVTPSSSSAAARRRSTRRGASEDPDTPGRALRRSSRLSTSTSHMHLSSSAMGEGAPPVPPLPMSASMGSLSSVSKTPKGKRAGSVGGAGAAGAGTGKTPRRRGYRAMSAEAEEGEEE